MKKTNEYKAGYDAGLNGPNLDNCHFSLFSSREKTKEWEKGNAAGKKKKEKSYPHQLS